MNSNYGINIYIPAEFYLDNYRDMVNYGINGESTDQEYSTKLEGDVEQEQFDGDFQAASEFQGSRKGYVFRNGTRGLGYYEDKLDLIKEEIFM